MFNIYARVTMQHADALRIAGNLRGMIVKDELPGVVRVDIVRQPYTNRPDPDDKALLKTQYTIEIGVSDSSELMSDDLKLRKSSQDAINSLIETMLERPLAKGDVDFLKGKFIKMYYS
jgi:hypothetical protein